MNRRNLLPLLAFAVAVLGPARAQEPVLKRFAFEERHMGTRFRIIVYAPEETKAKEASQAAFGKIADLDAMMSDYRPESELMRLCRQAGGPPVRVSKELFTVLAQAQAIARESDGAFDVTVGPLVKLWRRARRSHELPRPEQIAAAKALVGYQHVRLDPQAQTVQLQKTGVQLDLGGIAKGYAADEALAVLKKHGIDRALVAAGGDIAVSGPPPDAAGWTVGIAELENPDRKPSRYLLLHDAAVSTSGDAEQYVEIGGQRYSHIVDPRTGIGLVGRQSITVVAPQGIWSDSLTKVVSVLGPEKGLPIIDAHPGVAALVIKETPQGRLVRESKRFADVPKTRAKPGS